MNDGFEAIKPREFKNTYGQWILPSDTFKERLLANKIWFHKNKNGEWRIYTKDILPMEDLTKYQIMKNLVTFITTSKGSKQFRELNSEDKFDFPKQLDLESTFIIL